MGIITKQGVRILYCATVDGLTMEKKINEAIIDLAGVHMIPITIAIILVIHILFLKQWFGNLLNMEI